MTQPGALVGCYSLQSYSHLMLALCRWTGGLARALRRLEQAGGERGHQAGEGGSREFPVRQGSAMSFFGVWAFERQPLIDSGLGCFSFHSPRPGSLSAIPRPIFCRKKTIRWSDTPKSTRKLSMVNCAESGVCTVFLDCDMMLDSKETSRGEDKSFT